MIMITTPKISIYKIPIAELRESTSQSHYSDKTVSATVTSSPCRKIDRHYNIPLRITSIFLVLMTSAIAVYLPILLARFTRESTSSLVFTAIKQFGTGVIVATAFVHLLTHAMLIFANECVGKLSYEAFPAAIALGGGVAAFLVEYLGQRFVLGRGERSEGETVRVRAGEEEEDDRMSKTSSVPHGYHAVGANDDKLDVFVMEMGIMFHSVCKSHNAALRYPMVHRLTYQ
jgi:zinc transporter 1/2/3